MPDVTIGGAYLVMLEIFQTTQHGCTHFVMYLCASRPSDGTLAKVVKVIHVTARSLPLA